MIIFDQPKKWEKIEIAILYIVEYHLKKLLIYYVLFQVFEKRNTTKLMYNTHKMIKQQSRPERREKRHNDRKAKVSKKWAYSLTAKEVAECMWVHSAIKLSPKKMNCLSSVGSIYICLLWLLCWCCENSSWYEYCETV